MQIKTTLQTEKTDNARVTLSPKVKHTFWPGNSAPRYPREMCAYIQRTSPIMFIAALFVIAESINVRMDKLWHSHNMH